MYSIYIYRCFNPTIQQTKPTSPPKTATFFYPKWLTATVQELHRRHSSWYLWRLGKKCFLLERKNINFRAGSFFNQVVGLLYISGRVFACDAPLPSDTLKREPTSCVVATTSAYRLRYGWASFFLASRTLAFGCYTP